MPDRPAFDREPAPAGGGAPTRHGADRSASSRGERAVSDLRRLILSFALRPGESLSERRLEKLLAVSRSPVRAALARLAAEGLVRREGRSYRVAPVDLAEIEELFAYRVLLETAAVRWAAASAPSSALDAIADALRRVADEPGPEELLELSARFHLGFARACGNRFVADALAALFPRITRARYLELGSTDRVRQADDEHRRILQLVREHRGDEAAGLMRDHLERTCQNLVGSLEAHAGLRAMVGEALT
ncbi:MAG: GntR family transcriptional regulator [Deinococcales bacterium]